MARRGLLDARLAAVHPRNQTPALAVLAVGAATALCMFLGDAILVPITEVGSVASAAGWLAACAAYCAMGPPPWQRFVAGLGVLVGLLMVLMKIVPTVPGAFSGYEWLALALWIVLGAALGLQANSAGTLARKT